MRFLPLSGGRATLVGLYWMSVAEGVWRLELDRVVALRDDEAQYIYFAELNSLM